jgi:hypothetical protein
MDKKPNIFDCIKYIEIPKAFFVLLVEWGAPSAQNYQLLYKRLCRKFILKMM